jgi:hypothetical protein
MVIIKPINQTLMRCLARFPLGAVRNDEVKEKSKSLRRVIKPLIAAMFLFLSIDTASSESYQYVICQADQNGLTNCPIYSVPSFPRPAKGAPFADPTFHTTITRVTDYYQDGFPQQREENGGTPINDPVLIPEYSRPDIENSDGTKLLISLEEFAFFLFDANTYRYIKPLTKSWGGKIEEADESLEPKWDDKDPNVFYYHRNMAFYKYDIGTDTETLIRDFSNDFPNGWRIFINGGGNPSLDRRYWAFIVQSYGDWFRFSIFTYDMQENRIIGRMESKEFPNCSPYSDVCSMHMISISPYGDRVIVEWTWPSLTTAYDLDFSNPTPIGADGHTSEAIDAEGNQVYVIKDDREDVIAMIDIKTGKRTDLLKLPLSGDWDKEGAYHFSGNNVERPGWVLVSTYGYTTIGQWHHYLVFMLELKSNPRIWMIAHTHGQMSGDDKDYWAETKATINSKGTRVYWGSNWENPAGPVDTYQAILPETWWEDLGGAPISLVGDLNDDKIINALDVQLCTNVYLKKELNPTIVQKADVNHDNQVSTADIAKIIEISLRR